MDKKIILVSLIGIIAIIIIGRCLNTNSLLYQKLNGWSSVDNRFTEVLRNDSSYLIPDVFKFQSGKVDLPDCIHNINNRFPNGLKREREEYGKWKVISKKPASIQIEDPKAFFSGRYGIEFGIAKGYREDTLWILLSNDSTHIVLNKLSSSVPYKIKQKWLE